jgi:hypothetical protein
MNRSRLCRVAGALAAMLFVLLPLAGQAAADLVRDFDLIALRREFARNATAKVLKWEGPVRIHIDRRTYVGTEDLAFLQRHIVTLDAVTGVEMTYVRDPAESNFRILFVARAEFEPTVLERFDGNPDIARQVARRASCLTLFEGDGGPLVSATVIVHVDRARARGLLRRCMVEETTQSMGLVNDSREVGVSLFNDATYQVVELNAHDRSLLKMLYHPRIRAGMGRDEALEIAREILPELR